MAGMTGESLGWDDEVQASDSEYTVLAPGKYTYRVDKFERQRFDGSERMAACPMALLTLSCANAQGETGSVQVRLYLNRRQAWKLTQFFKSCRLIDPGTADGAVVEEAYETARFLGNDVRKFSDAGVAGLHRLIANLEQIRGAKVVIAVAGMEGALASVLAGLVSVPVIAVPTSVGYGASFGGLAALLAMLNSCANGVSVVNIDNGFGAAYNASLINHL